MEVSLAKGKPTIIVVGLNHRSAPIEVRERLAFNGNLDGILQRLLEASDDADLDEGGAGS